MPGSWNYWSHFRVLTSMFYNFFFRFYTGDPQDLNNFFMDFSTRKRLRNADLHQHVSVTVMTISSMSLDNRRNLFTHNEYTGDTPRHSPCLQRRIARDAMGNFTVPDV